VVTLSEIINIKKVAILKRIFFAGVVLCIALTARSASASLLWDWEILNNNVSIGLDDRLTIMGRLFNLPESDRNFRQDDIGGYGILDTELRPFYEVLGALPGEPDQFAGLNLAPGETFEFHHFILIPKAENPLTESTTFSFETSFVINQIKPDIVPNGFIVTQYTFNVEGRGTELPEPGSFALLGVGLLAYVFRSKTKK
jgi:PEP-CTERM motif